MSWSDLEESGPAARSPERCTCDREAVVPDIAGTLGCPGKWHELPGGQWRHTPPRRRRPASRRRETEATTRGNRT